MILRRCEIPSFVDSYNILKSFGKPATVGSRGVNYLRNINVIENPMFAPRRPGDNPAIGFVEGIQMIAGTAELEPIRAAAPGAKHSLFGLNSYYGPRIASQIPRVIDELNRSRGTRRAVLMIAHPEDSAETIPCTTQVQFSIDGDYLPHSLHATYTMRSCDYVYGMPYDLIQFNLLAHAIACCAHAHFHSLRVNVGNAHTYNDTVVAPSVWSYEEFSIPESFDVWSSWVQWARRIVYSPNLLDRTAVLSLFAMRNIPAKEGEYRD